MGKALTDAKKQIATQLYASGGMTVSDIARQIGVSRDTLSYWLNKQPWYRVKHDVKRRDPKPRGLKMGDFIKANKDAPENCFIIPTALPGMNEYIKALDISRYEGNKFKRETEEYIHSCIAAAFGKKDAFECVVQVHIHFVEPNRKRDYDNITSGTKFILDAMRKAGVIYNDGQSFLMPCTYSYATDPESPRVEVKITPHTEKKLPSSLIKGTKVFKAAQKSKLRYMSDGEIIRAYNAAANKKEQIKILAELNAISSAEVKEIVEWQDERCDC